MGTVQIVYIYNCLLILFIVLFTVYIYHFSINNVAYII